MKFFIRLPIFWLMFILHLKLGNIHTNWINTSDGFLSAAFQKRYHDEYKVKRVYEFKSGNYNYYLTTQLSSTEQGSPYISKIIRTCNDNDSDISGYGYIEIPIGCEFDVDSTYNLVQAAHIGKPGEDLRTILKIELDDDVLFAVFSRSDEINLSSNNPTNVSALCVYSLKQIDEKFTENIRNCFNGNGHRGFGSMLINQSCREVNQNISLHFCKSTVNLPMDGNMAIKTVPHYWEESIFTAIITNQVKPIRRVGLENNLYIGTSTGKVIHLYYRYNLYRYPPCVGFEQIVGDSHSVTSNFSLSQNNEYLNGYIMVGDRAKRFNISIKESMSIDCDQYNSTECNNMKGCHWAQPLTDFGCIRDCAYFSKTPPDYTSDFKISNKFPIDRVETVHLGFFKAFYFIDFSCTFTFENRTLYTGIILKLKKKKEDVTIINYCLTPEPDKIPRIPNKMKYLNATFSIQTTFHLTVAKMNITFFDCKLYTSFKTCIYSMFSCQWDFYKKKCIAANKKKPSGNNGTCPDSSPPSISSFQPVIGPWEGGTNITILGKNLGCDFEEISQDIEVAGVACTPYEETYKTSELITCLINKTGSFQHSKGPVELQINGTPIWSTQHFKFVDFKITDISPKEAYTYGGAELTIKGENLNAGRSIEVYIGYTLCAVLLRNESTLQCILNPSSTDKENEVVVKIDTNVRSLPNDSFKFVKHQERDEEGFNIIPKGIPAGGVQILIRDVDSHSFQELLLRINDENRMYTSSCEIKNKSTTNATWICLSPSISNSDSTSIDVNKPKEMNISYSDNKTNSKIQVFFENLPRKFLLYPNPQFDYFLNSSIKFGQNSYVIIQGHNIDKACQKSDIKVIVGIYDCEVISISSNQVICSLPTQPSVDLETDPEQMYDILADYANITVSIGANFNVLVFRPPENQYKSPSENSPRKHIIYVITISGAVLLSIIVFRIICRIIQRLRRVKKLEREVNTMRMQTIAVRQCIKRVIIKNVITLDENSSKILNLPDVAIEYTSLPRRSNGNSAKSEYLLPSDNEWEFPRSNLTLGECLGEGEFGKVVKGQAKNILEENIATIVAVKMLKDNHSDDDVICLVSEMEIMKLIGTHINVLRLLGCCTQDGALFVITEYAQHGNLQEFLRGYLSPNGEITENGLSQEMLIMFAMQVAEGMKYLASIKCIHRDLAARNILVTDDYIMKIADFGLSRDITNKEYYKKSTNGRIPVKWMAPESLCHKIYSTQSDVWSYGILLWEIFTLGGVPYPSLMNLENLYQVIRSGYRMEKPSNCCVEIYSLMSECWNFQPTERPSFSTIIQKLQDAHVADPKSSQ